MIFFRQFKKNKTTPFFFIGVMAGILSCSSKPIVHEFPPTAGPAEEIANLERDLNEAKARQVDILSPKNYTTAKNSLEDARKKFFNGKDPLKTLHEVAVGKYYLNNANRSAEIARENTEDVLEARSAAVKADAPKYFHKEFENADWIYAVVTKDIEKNNLKHFTEERTKLQQNYLELELKAIKESNLNESRNIIAQAKKEGAEKYAPRTLAIAEKSLSDTESYINAHPHSTNEIKDRVKATNNAARYAFNINRNARGTSKVSSEEMAILIQQERDRAMTNEQKLNSVQDELETTQSALEKEKISQDSLVLTKEELDAKKKELADLEVQKENLEAEKLLNDKYEEARQKFSSNEAEVYKQGKNLLIRLKGMEFPSATATIQSKNYPLLSKVEKIVEEFGSGTAITIEGHTDSVGSKTINNRLSTDRAYAVKKYLEANGGGIDVKIEALGYGDQKPLATNKTAKGRAQNRRVDIIVTPEQTRL